MPKKLWLKPVLISAIPKMTMRTEAIMMPFGLNVFFFCIVIVLLFFQAPD